MSTEYFCHEDKVKGVPFWDPTIHRESKTGAISDVIDVRTKFNQSVILTLEHPSPVGDVNVQISEGDIVYFQVINTPYSYSTTDSEIHPKIPEAYKTFNSITGTVEEIKRIRVNSEDRVCFVIRIYDERIEILAENVRFASIISRGNRDSMYQVYCNITEKDLDHFNKKGISLMVDVTGLKTHYHYSTCLQADVFDQDIAKYILKNESYFEISKTLPSDIYVVKLRYFDSISEFEPTLLGKIFVDADSGLFIPQAIIHNGIMNDSYYITGVRHYSHSDPFYKDKLYSEIKRITDHPYDAIYIETKSVTRDVKRIPTFEIESSLYKSTFPMGTIPCNSIILFYNIPYNNIFRFNSNIRAIGNADLIDPDSNFVITTSHVNINDSMFNIKRYTPMENMLNLLQFNDGAFTSANFFIDINDFMSTTQKVNRLGIVIQRITLGNTCLAKPEILVNQRFNISDDSVENITGVILPHIDTCSLYRITIKRYIAGSIDTKLFDQFEYDLDGCTNEALLPNSKYLDASQLCDMLRMIGMNRAFYININKNKCAHKVIFITEHINSFDVFNIYDGTKADKINFEKLYIDNVDDELNNFFNVNYVLISVGKHKLIGIDTAGNTYFFYLEIDSFGHHNFDDSSYFTKDGIVNIGPAYNKIGLKVYFAFPDNVNITHCSIDCTDNYNILNSDTCTFRVANSLKSLTGNCYPQSIGTANETSFADQIYISPFLVDTVNITEVLKHKFDTNNSEYPYISIDVVAHDDTHIWHDKVKVTLDMFDQMIISYDTTNGVKIYNLIVLVGFDFHPLPDYTYVVEKIAAKHFPDKNINDVSGIIFNTIFKKHNQETSK